MDVNINKIDFELKQIFETVNITEKTVRNNYYFTINATSKLVLESNTYDVSVSVDIDRKSSTNNIKWSYLVNPNDSNSDRIERVSTIDTISKDIHNIVEKQMLVKEYLNSLTPISEMINESNTGLFEVKKTAIDNIREALTYSLDNVSFLETKTTDNTEFQYHFKYSGISRPSDLFIAESMIRSIKGVDNITFNGNDILIEYSIY